MLLWGRFTLAVDFTLQIECAKNSLSLSRASRPRLYDPMCGLLGEQACHLAVRAAVTKNLTDVESLLALVPNVIAGKYPDEMMYGRSGFLYLLRMVRHWVPRARPQLPGQRSRSQSTSLTTAQIGCS